MGAGLPGFGIASLFYIAAALLAPFHELYMTARGRSSRARWAASFTQFGLGSGMLLSLVLFYVMMDVIIRKSGLTESEGPGFISQFPNWVFAAITLVIVMVVGALAGAVASIRSDDDHADDVAAAHREGIVEVVLDLRLATSMCERLEASSHDDEIEPVIDLSGPVRQPPLPALAARSVRL